MEGVGDAGGGYFYAFGIFGCQGAVLQRGGEEIDDSEGETLFGIESGRLVNLALLAVSVKKGRIAEFTMMALGWLKSFK